MSGTYIDVRRDAIRQESNALRGYARWCVPVPRHAPIDHWAEYQRKLKANATSKRAA